MRSLALLLLLPLLAAPLRGAAVEVPCEPGAGTRQVDAAGEAKVGARMAEFTGWTLRSGPWSSDRQRQLHPGQVQVVTFFATWCEPCARSIELFRALQKQPDDGVVVVFVAFGQDAEEVAPFVEAHHMDGVILLDPFRRVGRRFGAEKSIPRTVVLDARGEVRTIFATEGKGFAGCLERAVKMARGGPETGPEDQRREGSP